MDKLKFKSLVKVSGFQGNPSTCASKHDVTYEMTKSFAQSIAQFLEREHPDLIVSKITLFKLSVALITIARRFCRS